MGVRLHRGGRWRRWLGARLGGDEALGDRVWRRVLHGAGAVVLVYYLVPTLLPPVPNAVLALAVLLALLVVELLRLRGHLELPTIRPYERDRVGSYAYFALALVGAVLLLPRPVAVVVVLGTAIVDPVAGELRRAYGPGARATLLPLVTYAAIALPTLLWVGHWAPGWAVPAALASAALAVAVERPKPGVVDDDLAMTALPGLLLALVSWAQGGALAAFPLP